MQRVELAMAAAADPPAAGAWAARGLLWGWKRARGQGCHGAGSVPAARDDTSLCWRAVSVLEHSWLFHTHVLAVWISDKVMIQYMSGRYFDFFFSFWDHVYFLGTLQEFLLKGCRG